MILIKSETILMFSEIKFHFVLLPALILAFSCSFSGEQVVDESAGQREGFADVTSVGVSGDEGDYTFRVEVSSPDTGCDQYADWWEVVSKGGELIYRRVLLHSHVNEQPFTRSGGPVEIEADTEVWVRAHMNNSGYGSEAFFGSPESGFEKMELDKEFATDLENREPLPDGCAF